MKQVYATTDPNEAYRILSKYNAQYIVVGPLERIYHPEGEAKWEAARGLLWDLVYENPGVKIYRVIGQSTVQQ